ncbi:MAG: hypothetical protein BGO96_14055 [Micrococcales bacterium 73-15]|uniref:FAD-dependent oxidoreductase n=1 Tax=Salana multivorans TaxID=120377 RepID=UPI00095F3C8B|nr:FAD-dependent oxidoreductase [Salana multivorans]OJX98003.1 MAG: hypothetical protein BGO96_14055 [Micrococcales bacterium 73-15]
MPAAPVVVPLDGAPDVDVVVVGAGPAGASAALRLAERGLDVALVERAGTPGAKNLSGGVLYLDALVRAVGDAWREAPLERVVTRNVTTLLTADAAVSLDYADSSLAGPPARGSAGAPNAATVLRARFDPWLAGRAEAAGAFPMPGMLVEALAVAEAPEAPGGRRVVGVVAGGQVMRSTAVVLADGVNSFLARGAGLRGEPAARDVAVGVKAVLGLDPRRIADRFGVAGDEGAAHAIIGDATLGVAGGAFLYTNRESLSLGVVLRLDDLVASGRTAREVFTHLLTHPGLQRYVADTEVLEYGSHLVAEGGAAMVGTVAWPGCVVVGDAAGLTLNSGLVLRGMDLAITSGLAAGDAVADAVAAGDPDATLAYQELLTASSAYRDLAAHAGMPDLLDRRGPYGPWGETARDVLRATYRIDGSDTVPLRVALRRALRRQGWRTWLGDARRIWRSA